MKIAYIEKKFRPERLELIGIANGIIAEYRTQGFDLTLRQMYYQLVARGVIENTERSYKNTGTAIDDARMAGLMDWEAIVDRTRNLRSISHWSTPADIISSAAYSYRLDKWQDQEFYVEVWVEKEALAGVIERVATALDLPWFACRGYVSQSEMWAASQRFLRVQSDGRRPVILHLGDHDPSGIDMTRDIINRIDIFGADIEVKRLALNMDQIEQYNPPPNPAKALALNTPLPTPTGWTTMGEVKVGDWLFGSDGRTCCVIAKSDIFRDKRCFEFTFAGGDRIVSSEDHLWSVSARKRRGGIMTTAQIATTWVEGEMERPVYRMTVAGALELPDAALPLSPYVLGVWLGDGFSSGSNIACHVSDDEIRRHVELEGFKTARHSDTVVVAYGLRGHLVRLGVLENKHIPAAYLRASYEQRLTLLQGLMDTDGTVSDTNYRRGGVCSFGGSRKALVCQVAELLFTLGIRARVSESRVVLNGKDCGPAWRVEFYPGDLDVFRLNRKRNRLRGIKVAERQKWRTIIGVIEVESVETQCIAVDSPDHLFLAGRHLIPTHNTTDSRSSSYIDRFGDESWELDALTPTVISDLIEDAVMDLRDDDQWSVMVAKEKAERADLNRAAKRWSEVATFLNGSKS